MQCHVYLVPGFFGFTSLGALNYFHRVRETLESAFHRRNLDAKIVECSTRPTGSITHRADCLLQDVLDTGGLQADEIHFVGHSTGGLDIRLLVTPGVCLRPGDDEAEIGKRTRTVISVATPHFGTPLANFFSTIQGRHILQLLTLLATTTYGRHGIFWSAQLLQLVARIDDFVGRDRTFLDALSQRLLRQLTLNERDPIWEFLREVSADQGGIIQLTPEGMHLFNAAVIDRPGVQYKCMVTASPPQFSHRLHDLLAPGRVTMALLYALLYKLTSREHMHYPYPSPAAEAEGKIQNRLPFPLGSETNDGIVPTLSQVYGELVDAVIGDHLDVVGQFAYAGGDPLSDWLPSGAQFDEQRFGHVWDVIADTIAQNSNATKNKAKTKASKSQTRRA